MVDLVKGFYWVEYHERPWAHVGIYEDIALWDGQHWHNMGSDEGWEPLRVGSRVKGPTAVADKANERL